MDVEITGTKAPIETESEKEKVALKSLSEVENPFLPEAYRKQIEDLPKQEPAVELPEVVETTTEEKLQSARLELSFLKTQQVIEQQRQIAANIHRGFPMFVENLAKTHNVDLKLYNYDATEANFKRKK